MQLAINTRNSKQTVFLLVVVVALASHPSAINASHPRCLPPNLASLPPETQPVGFGLLIAHLSEKKR
jgi:hypothetical protein